MSEDINGTPALNLAQKLIEIRKSVSYVKKDTRGNNYSYASGTVVIGALKKKMDELGVLLEPNVVNKEVIYTKTVSNAGKERSMVTVQADMEMKWVDADNGDERAVSFACFGTQDDISKAFGSALTYSERFFMLKYFNIQTDDVDPDAFQHKTDGTVTPPKLTKSDFQAKIDLLPSLEKIERWEELHLAKAEKELNKADFAWFLNYIKQVKEVFRGGSDAK